MPIELDSQLYAYTYNGLLKKEISTLKGCFWRILGRSLRIGSSSARLERVFSDSIRSLDHKRYHSSVRQLANEAFLRSFRVALPAILRLAYILNFESKSLQKAKKLFVIENEPTQDEPSLGAESDSFPEEEEEVSKSSKSDHDHINYIHRSLNYHPKSFCQAVYHPMSKNNNHVARKHRITKNARPKAKGK